MKLPFLLPAALALVLSGLLHAAQAPSTGGARPSTSSTPRPSTMSGTTTRATTGGGGGGSSTGSSRQYTNSTMVGEATITSDLQTRRLIVVTDDETNENIRTIIASLDQPKPQVLINVVFVQVTHDKGVDLGAEGVFNGTLAVKNEPRGIATTRFGVADALADGTQYGAFYRILGQDVTATLRALSAVTKTEILSRPSVLTRNNQQATIMVGQSVPIITNSRVSDQTNTTINTVQYQDVGIILRVTPFITQEGLVEMIVSPEISSLSATTVPIGNNVSSPVIDKRSADTVVVTPSDKTIVIGGLISSQLGDRDSKVPLLGDIPLVGLAFKRKQKTDVKTELLIFLTPHVIRTPEDLSATTDRERAKLEMSGKAFEEHGLERALGKPAAAAAP
ncbi:MAG: type II secretion system protein GspD [Verrucomicrobiota bacterium]